MGAKSGPLAALGSLFGARIAGRACGGLAAVLLARAMGVGEFGRFAGALALVAFGGPLLQGALDTATMRALSRGDPGTFLRSTVGAKLWVGALTAVVLTGVAAVMRLPVAATAVLAVNAVAVAVGGSVQTLWLVRDRQALAAFAEGVRSFAWVAAALAVWLLGGGALAAASWRLLATAAAGLLFLGVARRSADLRPSFTAQAAVFRDALPFLLGGISFVLYQQADRLMLYVMAGSAEAGTYAAAANLVMVFYMLPGLFTAVYLPRMYREAGDRRKEGRLLEIRLGAGLLMAAFIVPVLLGLRSELLHVVYGANYASAAPVVLWLGGTVLLRFAAVTYGDMVTAADRQNLRTGVQVVAAVLNVGLNLVLIPRWGGPGAAAATLASETALLLGYAGVAWRLGLPVRPRLLVPGTLVCTGIAAAWLWQTWAGVASLAALLGAAGYGARRAGLLSPSRQSS